MDKKAKLLLAMSVSTIIFSGCTPSNTDGGGPYRVGQSAQNQGLDAGVSGTGVTHTHNGVAHTHRLPEGGLKHSHNIGTGSTNQQTCQPCGNRTNTVTTNTNTGGNCHTHAGRRHCHALPTTGTNHQHNTGAGASTATTNTYVNRQPAYVAPSAPAVVNTPPVNNSTYYDYTNTNSAPAPNSNYYEPAPAGKGSVPHAHNGQYHSHLLPASGVNHPHSGGTSFGGAYSSSPSASGSSSYYNGGSASNGGSSSSSNYSYSEASSGSCNTAGGNYYIVKPKDGVYRIGVNHGVKRDDIIRLNNLQMPDYVISPGQCLRLR